MSYVHISRRPSGDSNEILPSNPPDPSMLATTSGLERFDNQPIHTGNDYGYDVDMNNKLQRMKTIDGILQRNYLLRHYPETELRYLREYNDRLLAYLMESVKAADKKGASNLRKPIATKRSLSIRDWKRLPWANYDSLRA